MTVALVSGAGGFVGAHLCRHLHARGWRVRVVSSATGHGGEPLGISLLERDPHRLAGALAGVDAVFHLAGIAHGDAATAELLHAVNVDVPARWLAAAEQAGVPAFVWLSSIKVLGDVSAAPLGVDAPYAPGDAYARTKMAAEQRLLAQQLARTRLAVVRSPLVYGPGVKANFLSLLRWAASPLPLPLARAEAPRSLVAVDNLCELMMRLTDDAPAGVYHVADEDDFSVRRLITELRRMLGRPRRLFPMPPGLLRTAAAWLGRPAIYSRLFEPLQIDTAATRARLGWRPPRKARDALQDTVTWFSTSR
ncbi:MAG: NAD-dependent epimerase/dehydratase family protein [Pseudomonadales bacterium]